VGTLEHHQQHQYANNHHTVNGRNEDLAGLGGGCSAKFDAGQQSKLHRLTGHGESARNHRLAGDHRSDRGQDQHRPIGEMRHHIEEGARTRAGIMKDEGALTQVIERETGKDEAEPGRADGPFSKLAHIRIKRLRPGHREKDAAQDDEPDKAVSHQKMDCPIGTDRPQHRKIIGQM